MASGVALRRATSRLSRHLRASSALPALTQSETALSNPTISGLSGNLTAGISAAANSGSFTREGSASAFGRLSGILPSGILPLDGGAQTRSFMGGIAGGLNQEAVEAEKGANATEDLAAEGGTEVGTGVHEAQVLGEVTDQPAGEQQMASGGGEDSPHAAAASSSASAASADFPEEFGSWPLKQFNAEMGMRISHNQYASAKTLFKAWTALPGNSPSTLSYNFLLHAMMRSGATTSEMRTGLISMKKAGLAPNTLTYNCLLRVAFKERNSDFAEDYLHQMENSKGTASPDSDSYNLTIALCAMDRRVAHALRHMASMLKRGFVPSKTAYNDVLMSCARARRTRDATAVLKELRAQSIVPLPATLNELVVASFEAEDPECSLLVMQFVAQRQVPTDMGSLLLTLNLAARTTHIPLAEQTWNLVKGALSGRRPVPPIHLARIHAYTIAGNLTLAFRAMAEYEKAWGDEAAKAGHHGSPQGRKPDEVAPEFEAEELLSPLTSLKVVTNSICRSLNILDNAYFKLADMHAEGEQVALSAINCIVAGCAQLRDPDRAQQTFDEIDRTFGFAPDCHSYTALMNAYARSKQLDKALETLEAMKAKGIMPTGQTHASLVDAYVLSFQPAKAVEALDEMVEAGYNPQRALLMRVLRRSRREVFVPGVEKALHYIQKYKYRSATAGDSRRRFALFRDGQFRGNFRLSPKPSGTWYADRSEV